MATIADQYYLKALDSYPYDLESSLENVLYCLSYNEEHAGANCLMGQICAFQLKDRQRAVYHFDLAISADPELPSIYESYSWLLIDMKKLKKAEKLMRYAVNINGIEKSMVYHRMALILEIRKQYKLSKEYLLHAIDSSINENERTILKLELSRVKSKMKRKSKRRASLTKF